MKTTPIITDSLLENGFEYVRCDEEPVPTNIEPIWKKQGESYIIEYMPNTNRVYMGYKERSLVMPCYTWEQMRFYENIIGISDALCLRHPNKYCIVVDKCVLVKGENNFLWVEFSALTDQHDIVFAKMQWFLEDFVCPPIIDKAIRERGVFMDYNTLKDNL